MVDRLSDDSEKQKVLTEFILKLMQFESGCDFVAITTIVGGTELNEESSGILRHIAIYTKEWLIQQKHKLKNNKKNKWPIGPVIMNHDSGS